MHLGIYMSSKKMTGLAVVSPAPTIRVLLESDPHIDVVGEATNRQEAFDVASREQPNLFLVDVMLGDETAGDFLQELLEGCDSARAILLTGANDIQELERAINAGASGLVFKEEAVAVLPIGVIQLLQATP